MRCDDHITALQQPGRYRRFMAEDIQPRPGDNPALQRGNQRGLINHAAARDIDEDPFLPQRRQHRLVNEPLVCRRSRRADNQKITLRSQGQQSFPPGII